MPTTEYPLITLKKSFQRPAITTPAAATPGPNTVRNRKERARKVRKYRALRAEIAILRETIKALEERLHT